MSRDMLRDVNLSLRSGSVAQCPKSNRAIECTRALLEFYIYAQFKSHDDATLTYMEDTLPHFHTFKDVVLLRRAGNEAKAKANALRMELMEKRKVGKKTYVKTWTPSRKWCEMNAWRDDLSCKIDVSEKFDGDFILPKIHLLSHWVQQIP